MTAGLLGGPTDFAPDGHPAIWPNGAIAPARVLCADPPWRFADRLPGAARGAERHYKTLSVDDICNFELPPIADDA